VAFGRFRDALAAHEGIDLGQMEGFRSLGDERPRIPWDSVSTPLEPFLNHSDCDGELTPEQCRRVAPRLREVVAALWSPGDYNHDAGLLLADGMDAAAATEEPLQFC
jgi:hypothetical protein